MCYKDNRFYISKEELNQIEMISLMFSSGDSEQFALANRLYKDIIRLGFEFYAYYKELISGVIINNEYNIPKSEWIITDETRPTNN